MNPNSYINKISKRQDIQTYRGVAVICVMLYHLDPIIFSTGYLGVDIFFVISGYVISNLVYSQLSQKKFSLKRFYLQRLKRIVPSLVSFIFFVQILIYFILDHQFIYQTSRGNLFSLFFISNVYFSQISDYFSNSTSKDLIINLWSLSVEEQFYFVFPIIAIFTKRISLKMKSFIIAVMFAISLIFLSDELYSSVALLKKLFFTYDNYLFYSPFTRAWQFLLGILAMFLNQFFTKNKDKKSNISLALWMYISLVLIISIETIYVNKEIKLFISMLLIFFLLVFNFEIKYGRIISFILFTGNISYSLYLFHQPLFASIRNYNFYSLKEISLNLSWDNFLTIFTTLCIVYAISFINYKYIENKYRSREHTELKKFLPLSLISVIGISLIFLGIYSNGYSFRNNDVKTFSSTSTNEFLPGTNYISVKNIQCIDRDSINEICSFGSSPSNKNIYIFGDSIMSSLVSGFTDDNLLNDYKIHEFTRGGCPLLLDYCGFNDTSIKYQETQMISNSLIILGGDYLKLLENKKFESQFYETLKLFSKNNNQIFVFGTFPNPGINIRMFYLLNKEYPDLENVTSKDFYNKLEKIINELGLENVKYIDSSLIFCNKVKCNFYSKDSYYFLDHVHFSYFGAQEVSSYFIAEYLESVEYFFNKN